MRHGLRNLGVFLLITGTALPQVSPQRERLLGQHMATEIESRQRMITDPEVTGFVDLVLKNLSRGESLRLPLTLRIIDSSERIATALPGGYLLLSSGAILGADSEAELAALLAHAMGHVQVGPSGTPVKSSGAVPLIFVGGKWGACVRSGAGVARVVLPVGWSAHSDLVEAQADLLGLGYLTNGGYDPQALFLVFEHWGGKFGPDEEVRVKGLTLATAGATTILNSSRFDEIKARLAGASSPRVVPTLYKSGDAGLTEFGAWVTIPALTGRGYGRR